METTWHYGPPVPAQRLPDELRAATAFGQFILFHTYFHIPGSFV